MMKRSRTRFLMTIGRLLGTSVTKQLSGLMLTNWLKLRNLTRSRRKWKAYVILSSLNFTRLEECPKACLTWEAWAGLVLLLGEQVGKEEPDLPLRRSIKQTQRIVFSR